MYLYKEAICVPTFARNHYLYCCLKRIRAQDEKIPIIVFSDRGEDNEELRQVCGQFLAGLEITPIHNFHGNSYSVMEMLRWAFGQHIGLIHVVEDDFMMGPDCLAWYRKVHELPLIFSVHAGGCSIGKLPSQTISCSRLGFIVLPTP